MNFSNSYVEFKRGICWGVGRVNYKTQNKLIIENDIPYNRNTQSYCSFNSSDIVSTAKPKFVVLGEDGSDYDEIAIIVFRYSLAETICIAEYRDGYFQFPDKINDKQILGATISSDIYFPLRIKYSADSSGIFAVT